MFERDWENEYYKVQRQHWEEMDELRRNYRRNMHALRAYRNQLEEELREWYEKTQKVAEAYRRSNGQMTDELRAAIEELIARLPQEVNDDVV